jgi:hypothetical protein
VADQICGLGGEQTVVVDVKMAARLRAAQSRIGSAMALCTSTWFLPVVSGIACNMAERALIKGVLQDLGREGNSGETDQLFWFVRKKMLLLNVATYVPWVGTAFQLIEVYAMGQFTIHCGLQTGSFREDRMEAEWKGIEQEILSGERLIIAYETCTGRPFPAEIRSRFESTVEFASRAYRRMMRVPGIERVQNGAGEKICRFIHGAKALVAGTQSDLKKRQFALANEEVNAVYDRYERMVADRKAKKMADKAALVSRTTPIT